MKMCLDTKLIGLCILEISIILYLFPILSGVGNPLGIIATFCVFFTAVSAGISAILEGQRMANDVLEKNIQSIRERFIDNIHGKSIKKSNQKEE